MAAQTVGATASIAGVDQNDPSAGNNQATASFTVHGADLSLTKTVNNLYPSVGDAVVYTLTLSNGGPDTATNVQVTDYWPSRVIFGSATASAGSYDSATGRWSVPSLAAATAATLRLSGVLTAGVESNIANIAEITAADQPDGDSTPANHASSEDDYDEVALFTGVPPVVDGKLDIVYSLSPDVQRVCYTSGGVLFGVWHVLARPTENAIYTALVIDKEFVDNTYGVNAIGWPSGHTWSSLVGSDHAQFIGYDANGVEVTDFKLDYISSGFATPSGYANAGVLDGDAASVLASSTSMAYNLNNLGYCADGDCSHPGHEPGREFARHRRVLHPEPDLSQLDLRRDLRGEDGHGRVRPRGLRLAGRALHPRLALQGPHRQHHRRAARHLPRRDRRLCLARSGRGRPAG